MAHYTICDACGGRLTKQGERWKGALLYRCESCGAGFTPVVGKDCAFLLRVGQLTKGDGAVFDYIVKQQLDEDEDGERLSPVVAAAIAKGRLAAEGTPHSGGNMSTTESIVKNLRDSVDAGRWTSAVTQADIDGLARERAEKYFLHGLAKDRPTAYHQAMSEPLDPFKPASDDANPTLYALMAAAPADLATAKKSLEHRAAVEGADLLTVMKAKNAGTETPEARAVARLEEQHRRELQALDDRRASQQELNRVRARQKKEMEKARGQALEASFRSDAVRRAAQIAEEVRRGR